MKNRILFVVDHKHRDLPGLALTGYYLTKKGVEVFYRPLWAEDVDQINPKFIVFPKFNISSDLFLAKVEKWRKENRITICLESEGNIHTIRKKYAIYPEYFFFWGPKQLNIYSDEMERKNVKSLLTGCTRFDFYHKKYLNITESQKDIKKRFKLISDNMQIITISTRTAEAFLSDDHIDQIKERRKRMYIEPNGYYDKYIDNCKELVSRTIKLINQINKFFPNIQILLKPHPNENINFWKKNINSLDKNKCKLVYGENILSILKISNLNISHSLCTTSLESNLLNIPSLEMQTLNGTQFAEREHKNIAKYQFKSDENFLDTIEKELFLKKKEVEQLQSKVKVKTESYINNYFYKFDGFRCFQNAKELSKIVFSYDFKIYPIKKLNKKNHLKFSSFKSYTKKLLSSFILSKKDKRGRYDNRIRIGDEKSWYRAFRKHNI